MKIVKLLAMLLVGSMIGACQRSTVPASSAQTTPQPADKNVVASTAPSMDEGQPIEKVVKTDAQWKELLTPDQYNVMRQSGTEPPFHNAFWNNHQKGQYVCAGCGLELFSSDTKFDSGTGWPSFWAPFAKTHLAGRADHSVGMDRDEVLCARCGAHLGHVFDDGPAPTHLRYCINSASLKFVPAQK